MRKLTDLEAKTIRWMTTVNGIVAAPDPAIALTVRNLLSTEFATVMVTGAGRQALADYDRANADPHAKRLARGMSDAGRAALAEQEKGDA